MDGDETGKHWTAEAWTQRQVIVRRVLACLYDSCMIIPKGQLMAPVRQPPSQSVHQSHSIDSIIVTILSIIARALQRHTPMHKPHPSHFWTSIIGISIMLFRLYSQYLKGEWRHPSVIFVSRRHPHYFLQSFLVRNFYAMAVQFYRALLLQC